jgi:hypothetical protein
MTLAFDERKLLASGVHDTPLEEVGEHFGRLQRSDRRMKLFGKLREYVSEVRKAGWECSLIIDGSFVMPCVDEPEDIDLILVLPKDWDISADLKPHQYNLVSKKRVQKEYGIEVFVVRAGSVEEQKWITFFCQINIKWCQQFGWPTDSLKGIVRVAV